MARHFHRAILLFWSVGWIFVLFYCTVGAQSSSATYEWQDWDFYRLLGLDNDTHADDRTIKKAYRREAKQWHPDKLLHDKNIDTEEANQRFARIAEAYQVLSDPEARQAYDQHLMQRWEYLQSQQTQEEDENFSFFGRALDPRRIFEEMFGGSSSSAAHDEEDNYWNNFDIFDYLRGGAASGSGEYQQQQQKQDSSSRQEWHEPSSSLGELIQVREEEGVLIDDWGREILRVWRTEEYLQRAQSRIYTRVLARDFVEEWDPRTRSWVLWPIYPEPVLMTEGYRPLQQQQQQQQSRPSQNQQSPTSNQKQSNNNSQSSGDVTSFTLMPGETLTHQDSLVRGSFMACLTPDCQLVVLEQNDEDTMSLEEEEEEGPYRTLWTSDGLEHVSSNCVVQLGKQTGQLAVVVLPASGRQGQRALVELWSSRGMEDEDDFFGSLQEDDDYGDSQYVARLDTDGALSVYRIRTVPNWLILGLGLDDSNHDNNDNGNDDDTQLKRFHRFLRKGWQTAARGALNLQSHSEGTQEAATTRLVCKFSTSPVGCFRPARFLWKHTRPATRAIQLIWKRFDMLLDNLV